MKATVLDLRRRMREILQALDRKESVTILHRGKVKGVIYPQSSPRKKASVSEHPAFGIWRNLEDRQDVDAYVRGLRKGRYHVL
jgi:hypothetical protein